MIYILLPVHNRKNITEKFIHSLIKQTVENFTLILIDDGSTDGTADMVRKYLPDTIVIQGNGNLWWAGALQKGYEWLLAHASDADICLITNDDTMFNEDFLKTGVDLLNKSDKSLYLAQAYNKNNVFIGSGTHIDWNKLTFMQAKSKDEINCLSTRGLFLKVKDFIDIGGFHPILLPHYLSDYEFTVRAYNKGYALKVDDNLKLIFDTETTGLHKILFINYFQYLKMYFSKKYPSNPIYMLSFLVLACPIKNLPKNILKILFTTVIRLLAPNYQKENHNGKK